MFQWGRNFLPSFLSSFHVPSSSLPFFLPSQFLPFFHALSFLPLICSFLLLSYSFPTFLPCSMCVISFLPFPFPYFIASFLPSMIHAFSSLLSLIYICTCSFLPSFLPSLLAPCSFLPSFLQCDVILLSFCLSFFLPLKSFLPSELFLQYFFRTSFGSHGPHCVAITQNT